MASGQATVSPPPTVGGSTALRIGLCLSAVVLVAALAMLHIGASHLALLGLATILVLLVVIMTEAMSPLIALIAVPIAGALAGDSNSIPANLSSEAFRPSPRWRGCLSLPSCFSASCRTPGCLIQLSTPS